MPSPSAWNTLENTMATPAKQKLTEMMRRAGMPMESIVSDALNRLSSGPGATWKITVPSAMMAVVISSESRVAC